MKIYLTTNIINNKKYIGKDEGMYKGYLGSGTLLRSAIKKYGKENFKKEILAYAENKKELDRLEIYYIEKYNAQKSKDFYNLAPGGSGGKTTEIPPRSKEIFQYSLEGLFIKKWRDAKQAAIALGFGSSKLNLCARGERLRAYNFIWRYEYCGVKIDNFKILRNGISHPKYKRVYQYDKFGNFVAVYDSVRQISRIFPEFKSATIGTLLRKGIYNFYKNNYWFNDNKGLNFKNITISKKIRAVTQYSKDGQLVKTYLSCKEAALHFGAKKGTNIWNAIVSNGTAYGYKWRYAEK